MSEASVKCRLIELSLNAQIPVVSGIDNFSFLFFLGTITSVLSSHRMSDFAAETLRPISEIIVLLLRDRHQGKHLISIYRFKVMEEHGFSVSGQGRLNGIIIYLLFLLVLCRLFQTPGGKLADEARVILFKLGIRQVRKRSADHPETHCSRRWRTN